MKSWPTLVSAVMQGAYRNEFGMTQDVFAKFKTLAFETFFLKFIAPPLSLRNAFIARGRIMRIPGDRVNEEFIKELESITGHRSIMNISCPNSLIDAVRSHAITPNSTRGLKAMWFCELACLLYSKDIWSVSSHKNF